MLWFTVWTVLVLGTLTGAFLVGRRLWRSAVALAHELARASDVAARLAERTAELEEQTRAARVAVVPALGADPDEVRRDVERLRAVRREQRVLRRERRRGTVREAARRWYGPTAPEPAPAQGTSAGHLRTTARPLDSTA